MHFIVAGHAFEFAAFELAYCVDQSKSYTRVYFIKRCEWRAALMWPSLSLKTCSQLSFRKKNTQQFSTQRLQLCDHVSLKERVRGVTRREIVFVGRLFVSKKSVPSFGLKMENLTFNTQGILIISLEKMCFSLLFEI